MARRRGMSNQERLGGFLLNVTSTGTALAAPCFVYAVQSTLTATTATGSFSFGDSSASADLVKESTKWNMKFGTAGVSGQSEDHLIRQFMPPIYISQNLIWANATGINSVSFEYIPAS